MCVGFCKSLPELRCVKATFVHISKSHVLEKAGCLSLTKQVDRKSGLKKHFLHFKSANKWALNIGKIERERGVTSTIPTPPHFNLESTKKGSEQRMISSYYKE